MSVRDKLSLDEFATAPRRQRPATDLSPVRAESDHPADEDAGLQGTVVEDQRRSESTSEASKALRRMKRARMKGASHFVNVNLDRDTKRRLKLASFN